MGWYGVDLDGTLAKYTGWKGVKHIGMPIEPMVERVKRWLSEGKVVKIMTARVNPKNVDVEEARATIAVWCKMYIGVELPMTCEKDYGMIELWDDKAVSVAPNTGMPCLSWGSEQPTQSSEIYKEV